jgi:hypothetical protein
LCAIGCGIALLALGAELISTGAAGASSTSRGAGFAGGRSGGGVGVASAGGPSTSLGAGFAGGRSSGDGNAVGGDEIELAFQLPLCDGLFGLVGGAGDGVCGRVGGAGEGVCGRGGSAAAIAGDDTRDGGADGRGGGDDVDVRGASVPDASGEGGGGEGGVVRGGIGTAGTFVIGGGVCGRGAVIDFARGAFAGTGTTGFLVGSACSVCDARGDCAGACNAAFGGAAASGAAGSEPGDINRSSATSRSESSSFGSATRDDHCRSAVITIAM